MLFFDDHSTQMQLRRANFTIVVAEQEDHSFRFVVPKLAYSDSDGFTEKGSSNWNVRYFIDGGTPPYHLTATVSSLTKGVVWCRQSPSRGRGKANVSMNESGRLWVEFRATDARGAEQVAHVLFEKSAEGTTEPAEKPPAQSPEEPQAQQAGRAAVRPIKRGLSAAADHAQRSFSRQVVGAGLHVPRLASAVSESSRRQPLHAFDRKYRFFREDYRTSRLCASRLEIHTQ